MGKTTFAGELADSLRARGRLVVQVSADGFLHPAPVRHRRGRSSPEGFWLDSYDYPALIDDVLRAPADAVLVVDGLFLQRVELRAYWEMTIFLDAPFEVTVPRMAARDGSHPDPGHPSQARYVGGQRLYFASCDPQSRADVLIDHADLRNPEILRP
nr:uridine kinase [Actinoplanes bogorensis]